MRRLRTHTSGPSELVANDFASADLAKHTNDPKEIQRIEAFTTRLAEAGNQALADLKAGKDLEDIYRALINWRQNLCPSNPKFSTKIQEGDPNFDPFGVIEGKKENGKDTPETRERVKIGRLIARRFDGIEDDVIVNRVTLPDGSIIDGNRLHRGASADAIDVLKGKKYGYAEDCPKFITETASPTNQQKLHDAGVSEIGKLLARKDVFTSNSRERSKAIGNFANAAYLLYMGPLMNRGSDATIRVFLTAAFFTMFGRPCRLPQDIDVQAYARDQAGFKKWLVKKMRSGKSE